MTPLRLAAVVVVLLVTACSEPQPPSTPDEPAAPTNEPARTDVADAANDAPPGAPDEPVVETADDTPAFSGRLPTPGPSAVWMRKGLMIGTWSLDPELGLDEEWIDETGLREVFTKDRMKRREWRGFAAQSKLVPLDLLMDLKKGPIFGYVYSLVQRNRQDGEWPDETAVLTVVHRGPVKAWFDGELIFDEPAPLGGVSSASATVTLTDAYDVLLLKVAREDESSSMAVEVGMTDLQGEAIEAMTWNTVRIPGIPREIGPRDR